MSLPQFKCYIYDFDFIVGLALRGINFVTFVFIMCFVSTNKLLLLLY